MSCQTDPNNNWDLAILIFVILILLFFWFYKFLFITDPSQLATPFVANLENNI
jgi:hypothetical protein